MSEEKLKEIYHLLTGKNAWQIGDDVYGTVNVADGPCGLRKVIDSADFITQKNIVPTIAFPAPSALACSFSTEVTEMIGTALASDARAKGVDVLLAPGANIKRSALCGRNFEYFSEDPLLSGKMAAAYINGLENNGVGACLKHYVANNQEFARMINSSNVSLRALNEIYLRAFAYALEESSPAAIMTSYNRVNHEYVNESKYLLQDKLRNEYKFKGLIMSDWGAVSAKEKTVAAGLDVEMPFYAYPKDLFETALNNKLFSSNDLILRKQEIVSFLNKYRNNDKQQVADINKLKAISITAAKQCIVLLKNNNNILPVAPGSSLTLIGSLLQHPLIQGSGSSQVTLIETPNLEEEIEKEGFKFNYIEAYKDNHLSKDFPQIQQTENDTAIVFIGNQENVESEGFDRLNIDLDDAQIQTFLAARNNFKHIIVILMSGSVINIHPLMTADAIVLSGMLGNGSAKAIAQTISGKNNPGGRLSETWINSLKNNPLYDDLARKNYYETYYDEDIFVGYRYYDLHVSNVLFPFGFGLSYSHFIMNNFLGTVEDEKIVFTVDVTNVDGPDGDEVLLIFSSMNKSALYRPANELKAFTRVHVKRGEKKTVTLSVLRKSMAVYDTVREQMSIEEGIYEFRLMHNSQEEISHLNIFLHGDKIIDQHEIKTILRYSRPSTFSRNTPWGEIIKNSFTEKWLRNNHYWQNYYSDPPFINTHHDWPLRAMVSNGFLKLSYRQQTSLIEYLNFNQRHNGKGT